ncbi:uncharacterized protein [Primulina eburnea]|uniref:uncharacterized protein n=1 Tax=Primulina eburnea TaxID=1245227 RepID=UPI003C6CADAD
MGGVVLKVDISKAYDKVDWRYLKCILINMGFNTGWVHLIMKCVTSVRYSILLNDQSIGPVTPHRGLRQGDPLSPYLFILCAEGLSALIRKAEAHGYKVCRGAPIVSHLLFADDSFFFFRSATEDASVMRNILHTYQEASGQAINFGKSEKGGLGFRDLYGFNLAILRRQGWSFIASPDTLTSRIFKARYFPQGDFLTAQLGHNPSFVWKSIWSSQSLLKIGSRWKIGDGTKVNTWNDPWLREANNFWIQTPMIAGMESLMVAELMIRGCKKWDAELPNERFNAREMCEILKIPLQETPVADTRIWHYSKNGRYIVKSRYWVVSEIMFANMEVTTPEAWKQALYDWLQAKERRPLLNQTVQRAGPICKRWHKPPPHFLKCNTDAAIFTDNNTFGLSSVLRDENGEFMACRVQHGPGNPMVKECEFLALLNAITWIKEMNMTNVIFELDAKTIVDVIKSSDHDTMEFGFLVHQCKHLINQGTSFSVQFAYRQANALADTLAKAAHFYASPSIYFESPSCLIEHLDDYCNFLHD